MTDSDSDSSNDSSDYIELHEALMKFYKTEGITDADTLSGQKKPKKKPELIEKKTEVRQFRSEDSKEPNQECSMCYTVFCPQQVIKILQCQHFFHEYCINQWLKQSPNCPLCRQSTVETKKVRKF